MAPISIYSLNFHRHMPFLVMFKMIIIMAIVSKCEQATNNSSASSVFVMIPHPNEDERNLTATNNSNTTSRRSRSRLQRRHGDDAALVFGYEYFTMLQVESGATLEIKTDGRIKWDRGSPTLYSVLREQMIEQKNPKEIMVTLEAAATPFWICMNAKGRPYTVHRDHFFQIESRRRERHLKKIRHIKRKIVRIGVRRWMVGSDDRDGENDDDDTNSIFPPSECLFKMYNFAPTESYEYSVGIYSFTHSNSTHGRFLSINMESGKPRSYRKPFRHLAKNSHLRISQEPIMNLKKMVKATLFGREEAYNKVVRDCILHLGLSCNRKVWWNDKKGHILHRIMERCKKRAMERKTTLPKCSRKKARRRNRKGTG